MKKMTMLLVCFAVASIQSVMAQTAKIILNHLGQATFFDSNRTSDALNAAVDGDTIYFNGGRFSGNITITKKVSLIGAGAEGSDQSIIDGSIILSPNDGDSVMTARLLDGLYVSGDVVLSKANKGVVIRKCCFDQFSCQALSDSTIIDRCVVGKAFVMSAYMKGVLLNNCAIKSIKGAAEKPGDVTFSNCNILTMDNSEAASTLCATYRNCILGPAMSTVYYDERTEYIKCLVDYANELYKLSSSYSVGNCYSYAKSSLFNGYECAISLDSFLGDDNTQVGMRGGDYPFSLAYVGPRITDYEYKVDSESRMVTITLTVNNK